MHHARQHAETRTRERRQRLAHEAARLMAEGGIRDYHQAKLKAASRLGIHDDASLPRNREIEDALRTYLEDPTVAGAAHAALGRSGRGRDQGAGEPGWRRHAGPPHLPATSGSRAVAGDHHPLAGG